MRFEDLKLNNVEVLDRICIVYGFTQKIQLANHFNIAASSLSNRYTRGAISYDFAALCSLETGANLEWILTGNGERFIGEGIVIQDKNDMAQLNNFTLSEGRLSKDGVLSVDIKLFSKPLVNMQSIRSEGKTYFVEQDASLSDGLWLVDIEGAISIRELTVLPAKKLHVAGGKVPFECTVGDIITLGRVIGTYSEAN
ncbi:phage repressor protein CI [Serratia fonticola]|uniref:Phage repressor protein CI n=1 Tax=Serratia fonticola TaxID=47917 RepID=A0AAJ1YAX8_SERFO|nr:phage repressor protein CI [Serratia fonticola]MDQ9126252.1 phage repressor protein CI [Serratia fonticola]